MSDGSRHGGGGEMASPVEEALVRVERGEATAADADVLRAALAAQAVQLTSLRREVEDLRVAMRFRGLLPGETREVKGDA